MVDDSHATGFIGKDRSWNAWKPNEVMGRVDIITSTLEKLWVALSVVYFW